MRWREFSVIDGGAILDSPEAQFTPVLVNFEVRVRQ
jgi:hypothetical protein